MNNDYTKKLEQQIRKTGFPTELEIGRIFKNLDWEVEHNTYFIDKDEKKGREIDIIADHLFQYKGKKGQYTEFTFRFVVEIKNEIDKPWIVFTTETTPFEKSIYSIHSDKTFNNFENKRLSKSFKKHNLKLFDRLGRSFTEAFSQGKDKIYSSMCNTIKAFNYAFENVYKDTSTDSVLTYIEPLIIVNGQLFEAYLNEKAEILLDRSNHLQFRFNYISENYKKRTHGYLLNIITKEYLEEYLKLRTAQFQKIFTENKYGLQQKI